MEEGTLRAVESLAFQLRHDRKSKQNQGALGRFVKGNKELLR